MSLDGVPGSVARGQSVVALAALLGRVVRVIASAATVNGPLVAATAVGVDDLDAAVAGADVGDAVVVVDAQRTKFLAVNAFDLVSDTAGFGRCTGEEQSCSREEGLEVHVDEKEYEV